MAGNYDPGFDPDHPDPNDPLYYPDAPPAETTPVNAPGQTTPPAAAHKTGAPTPQDWATATAGLTANERDQGSLNEVVKRLQGMGYNVTAAQTDSQGRNQGLIFDGVLHRVIDSGNQWTFVSNADGNAWGSGGGGAAGVDASYLQPFTQSLKDFAPGAYGVGDVGVPDFKSPGAFHAPTGESVMSDPGYKFREDRLRGSIENSAAARGLTNSRGTIDEILGNVGNFASQEYGNVWNRDFNLWNSDWSHAADAYGLTRGATDTNYQRLWNQYLTARDTAYQNQDRPFDKLSRTADRGVQASL